MREAQGLLWCGSGELVRGGGVLLIQAGEAVGVMELPLIGEPGVKLAHRPGGQVYQQLGEVELRIDLVPATGGRKGGENGGGTAAARIADEKGILAIQYHSLHFPFRHVVVDGNGAIGTEDVEFVPLAERVVHGFRHGMLGQELFFPVQQVLPQFGQ